MGALNRVHQALLVLVACVAMATAALAQDPGGRRVALVIGNSAYATVGALANPANDATAVAESLTRLGFDVTHLHDLDFAGMRTALQEFEQKVIGADIAVVFYAGHGMEMGGENYLIPTDARLLRDTHVSDEAIALSRVLSAVQPAQTLRIVLLDACRNNPFLANMETTGRQRAVTRGLARVEPGGATLVAYAAKEGTTADDGVAEHSPFTSALLQSIETPGLEVRLLFGRVRDDVLRATGGIQEPFVYNSLGGTPIFLKDAIEAQQNQQQGPAPVDPDAMAAAAYNAAVAINTIEAWDAFLKYHDGGYYGDLARAARNKLDPPEFVQVVPDETQVAILDPNNDNPITPTSDSGELCDALTAYEYDPQRPASVIPVDDITLRDNSDAAIQACTAARQDHPNEARYAFQLARVQNLAGDTQRAIGLYREAINLGSAAAMNDLGAAHQLGNGVTQDYVEAFNWYTKAAAGGSSDAMANLGNLYDQGFGVSQDFAQSGAWYQRGADLGNAEAMAAIGYRFQNGRGVTVDYAEARRWYEKAALKNSNYAQNSLGFLFDYGLGGGVDSALARYWYEKAAVQNNGFAMANLGFMYENGRGVAVDYQQSRSYYEQAAATANAFAMNKLGDMYANGLGVTADINLAFTWYYQGANAGSVEAMNSLGNMYDGGTGTTQDYAQAKFWYEKAAAAGSGNAVHNLGYLYETGHGVARDTARAAQYYVQALSMKNAATISEFRDNPNSYSPEVRRAVQQFLIDRGYLTGPADGVIGTQSQQALNSWASS